MLPGKTYKPEEILKILRKRYWLVLVPWAIVAAGTAGVARKLPDMYESKATIQVVPPQVPNNIVQQNNQLRLQDRLQATQQAILSRTRLERLILDFDLYRDERKKEIMEDVVERMRTTDIRIDPVKGDTFSVAYRGRTPSTVMKVAERLAGFFKDENANEGVRRAEGASSFVESQVEEARRDLQATEEAEKKYRLAHSGELPEQLDANMQAINSINHQLSMLTQMMSTDSAAKTSLERNISILEAMDDTVTTPTDGTASTATQKLAQAKKALAAMLDKMSPNHPDVKIVQSEIARLTREAETEAKSLTVATGAAVTTNERTRQARLTSWKEDLEALKKRINQAQEEEKRLRAAAATYQARIDRVPQRRAELADLKRDYETRTGIYNDLVHSREKSKMSVDAERRQLAEQFVLLDAARLPERPFSPNRVLINILGVFGGLALGLGLVALVEYRDSTFKTDSELANVLGLPVLAVVPLMRSDSERRTAFRRSLAVNVGLASTVLVCLAVLTYSFVFIR